MNVVEYLALVVVPVLVVVTALVVVPVLVVILGFAVELVGVVDVVGFVVVVFAVVTFDVFAELCVVRPVVTECGSVLSVSSVRAVDSEECAVPSADGSV